jgi:hypothetical protein
MSTKNSCVFVEADGDSDGTTAVSMSVEPGQSVSTGARVSGMNFESFDDSLFVTFNGEYVTHESVYVNHYVV